MFGPAYKWTALIAAKGLIVSAMMFALDVDFWKQLIIASVSSLITGIIILLLGRALSRVIVALHKEIEHVKAALGINRRAEDDEL